MVFVVAVCGGWEGCVWWLWRLCVIAMEVTNPQVVDLGLAALDLPPVRLLNRPLSSEQGWMGLPSCVPQARRWSTPCAST